MRSGTLLGRPGQCGLCLLQGPGHCPPREGAGWDEALLGCCWGDRRCSRQDSWRGHTHGTEPSSPSRRGMPAELTAMPWHWLVRQGKGELGGVCTAARGPSCQGSAGEPTSWIQTQLLVTWSSSTSVGTRVPTPCCPPGIITGTGFSGGSQRNDEAFPPESLCSDSDSASYWLCGPSWARATRPPGPRPSHMTRGGWDASHRPLRVQAWAVPGHSGHLGHSSFVISQTSVSSPIKWEKYPLFTALERG